MGEVTGDRREYSEVRINAFGLRLFVCTCTMRKETHRLISVRKASRAEFPARHHVPIGTPRDWEQNRKRPDAPALAYLRVIAQEPGMVERGRFRARRPERRGKADRPGSGHSSHSGTRSPAHSASIGWRSRIAAQRSPSIRAAAASGRAL
jgi:hypothetical protein